ncbi:MAG: DUF1688 family protein [Planctomycetota bacterium]
MAAQEGEQREFMEDESGVDYILSAEAVRQRAEEMLAWAEQGHTHFAVNFDRFPEVVDEVVATTRERFPDLQVPLHSRWRHFQAEGHDRLAPMEQRLTAHAAPERCRARIDLAVVSVILGAGAGSMWSYRDEESGSTLTRSEGLAVATLRMFLDGLFSAHRPDPCRVDAARLVELELEPLAAGFQVSDENPLVGLEERLQLLQRLGATLRDGATGFPEPRPGSLFDACAQSAAERGAVPATGLLRAVLFGLGEIWPPRLQWEGIPIGDVWHYEPFGADDDDGSLVPFHTLSQWLTYSLIEPLEDAGVPIDDLEGLTGLAEYRNGGLLLDTGLLQLREPHLAQVGHTLDSDLVVEWRGLTIALLDRIAADVRRDLGVAADEWPLHRVLEGGTWWAGRRLAHELRDGEPPLRIVSDGTVF